MFQHYRDKITFLVRLQLRLFVLDFVAYSLWLPGHPGPGVTLVDECASIELNCSAKPRSNCTHRCHRKQTITQSWEPPALWSAFIVANGHRTVAYSYL